MELGGAEEAEGPEQDWLFWAPVRTSQRPAQGLVPAPLPPSEAVCRDAVLEGGAGGWRCRSGRG